eukprot:scaffold5681_cov377-Prasinococcus_capsulatus_cf.AAC.9
MRVPGPATCTDDSWQCYYKCSITGWLAGWGEAATVYYIALLGDHLGRPPISNSNAGQQRQKTCPKP